jgi:hypothetical protein
MKPKYRYLNKKKGARRKKAIPLKIKEELFILIAPFISIETTTAKYGTEMAVV